MGTLKLYHPEAEGLLFGEKDDGIQFGIRAGLEPGYALVDEDHPLLPLLLEHEPLVRVVNDDGPAKVYICPFHVDREFQTRNAFLAHLRGKGHEAVDAARAELGDEASHVTSIDGSTTTVVPSQPDVPGLENALQEDTTPRRSRDGVVAQPPTIPRQRGR